MSDLLWRIILAVIAVVILFALIPLILGLFAIPNAGNVSAILRIVIGGLALLYVLGGQSWFRS